MGPLALADFNPKVREHVAAALAASRPKGVHVAIALRDALFDKVEAVRWYAAAALSEMGSQAKIAVPALVTVYFEDVEIVRTVAMEALTSIVPDLNLLPIENIYVSRKKGFVGPEAKTLEVRG